MAAGFLWIFQFILELFRVVFLRRDWFGRWFALKPTKTIKATSIGPRFFVQLHHNNAESIHFLFMLNWFNLTKKKNKKRRKTKGQNIFRNDGKRKKIPIETNNRGKIQSSLDFVWRGSSFFMKAHLSVHRYVDICGYFVKISNFLITSNR